MKTYNALNDLRQEDYEDPRKLTLCMICREMARLIGTVSATSAPPKLRWYADAVSRVEILHGRTEANPDRMLCLDEFSRKYLSTLAQQFQLMLREKGATKSFTLRLPRGVYACSQRINGIEVRSYESYDIASDRIRIIFDIGYA